MLRQKGCLGNVYATLFLEHRAQWPVVKGSEGSCMGGLVSHINTVFSKPRCPWNPFGNQNIFLHSFCSVTIICWARTKCQALTEQSGSGPCAQGIDSRHRSHSWGLSLRERVWAGGECRQLHGHPPPTPDFLCTDRHFLHEPLPGLVRTVIADPPQPSAPLWELVLKGGAETVRVVGVGLVAMGVLTSW